MISTDTNKYINKDRNECPEEPKAYGHLKNNII